MELTIDEKPGSEPTQEQTEVTIESPAWFTRRCLWTSIAGVVTLAKEESLPSLIKVATIGTGAALIEFMELYEDVTMMF
jgi:hypothetical protein